MHIGTDWELHACAELLVRPLPTRCRYYRLVEHCPAASGGLPCNPLKECTHGLGPSPPPGPSPPSGGCTSQLAKDGCRPSAGAEACDACAGAHQADLRAAGCTSQFVRSFCASSGPAPSPPGPPSKGCETELDLICPVATDPTPMKCGECAKIPLHYSELVKAGCTPEIVKPLCEARGGRTL